MSSGCRGGADFSGCGDSLYAGRRQWSNPEGTDSVWGQHGDPLAHTEHWRGHQLEALGRGTGELRGIRACEEGGQISISEKQPSLH